MKCMLGYLEAEATRNSICSSKRLCEMLCMLFLEENGNLLSKGSYRRELLKTPAGEWILEEWKDSHYNERLLSFSSYAWEERRPDEINSSSRAVVLPTVTSLYFLSWGA
ncbi:hypothetical protein NPIL_573751 [Nephila pilipes]|uniref:Uncharacterized protein n=1 Tax=Nephila pilipes TaxID=299642 RepID=A0A8X6NKT9_NEPPI|nr:hypothetical protein NPIL_573751 [Nephila pilipes]